ncbi:L,D-transpeptidase family protein [Ostreibacterium oceani]|uniref:L,D-transpeptidase family protein n=1 Tax=Ostreibacterium oceani TaxID=2654998 RepID=A0A6N7EU80_9GAMM|nr:L,D-transpeptidase family protein [Ostreibacterium oceani]MPV85533.1 L,D-transpeptidase family protein [Ostreibacterium oceani]
MTSNNTQKNTLILAVMCGLISHAYATERLGSNTPSDAAIDRSKIIQPYITLDGEANRDLPANDLPTKQAALSTETPPTHSADASLSEPPLLLKPSDSVSNNALTSTPAFAQSPNESLTYADDLRNDSANDSANDFSDNSVDDPINPIESRDTEVNLTPEIITSSNWVSLSPEEAISNSSPEIAMMLNNQTRSIHWRGVNNQLRSLDEVTQLYAQLNYQPLWIKDGKATQLAEQLIRHTLNARYHALRPEVYHTSATSGVRTGDAVSDPYQFDVLLTDAFVTLSKHLTNGIVNPKQQFSTWNLDPQPIDFKSLYLAALTANDASQLFVMDDQDYLTLQYAYQQALKSSEQTTEFPPIPTNNTLRLGSTGEAVALLRQHLGLSEIARDGAYGVYDETVKNAVMEYQQQHGLSADGIAGRRTLSSLNGQTPQAQLETLAINLERHRWGYIPQYSNYVWVNIPGYTMTVKNRNETLFESKVVVGRPARPTPVFSDVMEHVVLSPYWNVPSTIFREDKLPQLRRNPNALGSSMQVVNTKTGQVVNPASVNWSNGGSGYRLRQKPGARNALGNMKFLFPNKHAIYLHDTPDKHLFDRTKRAYSSGCVRVEKAEDFALFLLDNTGYDKSRIKKDSRLSREKWLNLKGEKQYPVFLKYYTAWVDSTQNIRFSDDIYGHDKKMKQLYQTALNNL